MHIHKGIEKHNNLIIDTILIEIEMGLLSTIFGFFGFGIGISIGLISGYFLFIYIQPTHVQVLCIKK
jgi:hypothetical protein